jgi:hypothetical protein
MIKLPEVKRWTGDGFGDAGARILTLINRNDHAAIYKRTVERSGGFEGYEVFTIKVRHKGDLLPGGLVEPEDREVYPAAGSFGKTASHVWNMAAAEAYFNACVTKQNERDEEDAEAALTGSVVVRRGRPKSKKSETDWLIPAGQFTHEDFAVLNNTQKGACYLSLRSLVDAGTIVLDGTRSSGRGKPTNLFRKA